MILLITYLNFTFFNILLVILPISKILNKLLLFYTSLRKTSTILVLQSNPSSFNDDCNANNV